MAFTTFDGVIETWKQRNFAWYMSGAAISLFGVWAQRIAVAWLTWKLTGSYFWLGLIAFADLFPTVIITPLAGVIADRVDRRKMSIYSQLAAAFQAIVLATCTLIGVIEIWSLLTLTVFLGVALAYNTAARLALVPNLLEPRFIPSALASDAAIYNSARVIGPMIAAWLIAEINIGGAFVFNCVTYVIFLFCLFKMRLVRHETSGRTGGVFLQTLEGVRYAAKHPGIGPLLVVLTALAIGVKPFLEMLPAFAEDVFKSDVHGFAWLAAAAGFGAISCAIFLAVRGRSDGLTRITLSALFVGPFGILIMCFSNSLWLGLIGSFIVGTSITLTGTGVQTLMQTAVEGHLRGRVMSLYGMLHRGVPAIGALVVGGLAEFIGLSIAMIGIALIFCVGAAIWIYPRHKKIIQALETGSN